MSDLISRQAAINAANDWLLDCLNVQKQDRSCGLIRRLEDLPSAEPEIIRCKDCKRYMRTDNKKGNWCRKHHKYAKDENYCSWAERRTDETDCEKGEE